MSNDEIYEQIDKELNGGGLIRGLWTRVYAEVDGDEAKAKARYIKARAEQLLPHNTHDDNGNQPKRVHAKFKDVSIASAIINDIDTLILSTNPFKPSKRQLDELKALRIELAQRLNIKYADTIKSLSEIASTDGGGLKIYNLLNDHFTQLTDATRVIPEDLSHGIIDDIFINIHNLATIYLLVDIFRVELTTGWLSSSEKRQTVENYNGQMARQARIAVLYVNLTKLLYDNNKIDSSI